MQVQILSWPNFLHNLSIQVPIYHLIHSEFHTVKTLLNFWNFLLWYASTCLQLLDTRIAWESHGKGTSNTQTHRQTDMATTRPTRPRGLSWWKNISLKFNSWNMSTLVVNVNSCWCYILWSRTFKWEKTTFSKIPIFMNSFLACVCCIKSKKLKISFSNASFLDKNCVWRLTQYKFTILVLYKFLTLELLKKKLFVLDIADGCFLSGPRIWGHGLDITILASGLVRPLWRVCVILLFI